MSATTPVVVRATRRFEASAERVFDAFLDPAKAGRFLFATPAGRMVRAEIDPRVGGAFVFVDRRDGVDAEHVGEYLEVDRPRRLVFEFWMPQHSPDRTRVVIEIVGRGAGCELTLTHEMQPEWAHMRDRVTEGWTMILDGLAKTIE